MNRTTAGIAIGAAVIFVWIAILAAIYLTLTSPGVWALLGAEDLIFVLGFAGMLSMGIVALLFSAIAITLGAWFVFWIANSRDEEGMIPPFKYSIIHGSADPYLESIES